MVLKELILTFSTLEGCGGLERTDFLIVATLGGWVFLKELILIFSTLEGCGGLERTDF